MFSIHVYLHFIIHPDNMLSTLDNLSQQDITNTIYYKLPFIINTAELSLPTICMADYKQISKIEYSKSYDSISLLEPLVKFFTKNTIYELKKNKKIPLHFNLECRNFYIVHKGSVVVTLKNPKHKEDIKLELKEKQILFVPNYWKIKIKSTDNTIIEKLQYKTIMNQFNFLWNYIININIKNINIKNIKL